MLAVGLSSLGQLRLELLNPLFRGRQPFLDLDAQRLRVIGRRQIRLVGRLDPAEGFAILKHRVGTLLPVYQGGFPIAVRAFYKGTLRLNGLHPFRAQEGFNLLEMGIEDLGLGSLQGCPGIPVHAACAFTGI